MPIGGASRGCTVGPAAARTEFCACLVASSGSFSPLAAPTNPTTLAPNVSPHASCPARVCVCVVCCVRVACMCVLFSGELLRAWLLLCGGVRLAPSAPLLWGATPRDRSRRALRWTQGVQGDPVLFGQGHQCVLAKVVWLGRGRRKEAFPTHLRHTHEEGEGGRGRSAFRGTGNALPGRGGWSLVGCAVHTQRRAGCSVLVHASRRCVR